MNVEILSASRASGEAVAEQAGAPEIPIAAFATLLHRGVERLAGLQKTALDIVGQQTADANQALRKSFESFPATSAETLLGWIDQAVEGGIGAQKEMIDLMVRRSAHAEATILAFAAERNKAPEKAAQNSGLTGTPEESVAESARRGFGTLGETQKEVLAAAAKPAFVDPSIPEVSGAAPEERESIPPTPWQA